MVLVYLKSVLLPAHQYTSLPDLEKCRHPISSSQEQPTKWRISPRVISDLTIGLSDGLTVPFALTAGLSALGESKVVIYAGLADLIAGGISMGLGGYLGARSERQAYLARLAETRTVVEEDLEKAGSMVRSAFVEFRLSEVVLDEMIAGLEADEEKMVKLLMRFVHGLGDEGGDCSRAYVSGLTISGGYVGGGLVALLPYLVFGDIQTAFLGSAFFMAVALFTFGWIKTALVGEGNRVTCLNNGIQMLFLGGIAAAAAMGCVKAVGT